MFIMDNRAKLRWYSADVRTVRYNKAWTLNKYSAFHRSNKITLNNAKYLHYSQQLTIHSRIE